MEEDGLVKRTAYPEIPPRVDYEITNIKKTLIPFIKSLSKWAHENTNEIKKSRAGFK